MAHKYTQEQIDFIKNNVKGRSRREMTDLFNTHFGLDLGLNQITAFIKNHKLSSGLCTQFTPGFTPYNKGKKGICHEGMKPTQFKSGQMPHNYRPVGSERINANGYAEVKIADPKKWKGKHIIVWEAANGPLPNGFVIIFADGNKSNFDLDNLLLVSRQQLVRLNQNHLIQSDAELTKTGIIIADIYNKIGERKKKK